MRFLKYIFYFILFFTLFYFENFKITESLTFSQAWKIPLVIFMVLFILAQKKIRRPKFTKIAYLSAMKNAFNPGILSTPITNLIETFRFSNLPLLYDTFSIYFKSFIQLQVFIVRISQYFILSGIPFLLGILQSRKEGMEFGNEQSFVGIFQNPHGASIVLCFALLVLIYHLKTNKLSFFKKAFNVCLIILGLFCLYMAFVRTGYLMFLVGMLILFFPSGIKIKQAAVFLSLFLLLAFGSYQLIQTNDSFRQRILDQRKDGETADLGSGRLIFAAISLQFWYEGNIQQMILGRGLNEVKDNLERKTGMRIFSHNGFVDALVINGILGFILFVSVLYLMYKNIRSNNQSKGYQLALAMFFSYVVFQLTQGGAGFPTDLYMVSVLNMVSKNE